MQSKQHLDQSYERFVSKNCSKDCWKPPSRAISEYCPPTIQMQSKQHLDQSYERFVSKNCSKDCWKPPSRAISEYCPLERAISEYCPLERAISEYCPPERASAKGNIRYIALQFPLILQRKVVYVIVKPYHE